MVSSGGLRIRVLLVVALVVGLLGLVALRLVGGPVPTPGWAGVVLLVFTVMAGTPGPNRYGPVPT